MNIIDALRKKTLVFEEICSDSFNFNEEPIYVTIDGIKYFIGYEYSIKYRVYNDGIKEGTVEEVEAMVNNETD